MSDTLLYRNGVKVQRQIKITTASEDILIIDFLESAGRKFEGKYHILLNSAEMQTVAILRLFTAWLEHDANNFHHSELTITDD